MANRKYRDLAERLLANSVLSTEHYYNGTPCWDWLGNFGTGGGEITGRYPQINIRINGKHKALRAHRVSYETFTGNKLGELEAGHLCNRTCCIAPLHLTPQTKSENRKYQSNGKPCKSYQS